MIDFLKVAIKAGFGLAAIAAAIFWSIHEGFIQADLFSQMSSDQTLVAFKWSTGIAGLLLLVSILLSFSSKPTGKTITADNGGVAVDNSGFLNKFNLFKKNKGDR